MTMTLEPMSRTAFRANVKRRTVTGLLLPWNRVATESGGMTLKFRRGTIELPSPISRVKLLRDHDPSNPIGVAEWIDDLASGLHGSFRIARGDQGDQVLKEVEDGVLDGFSVGPRVDRASVERDPNDPRVSVPRRATLVEVSLVALPAFDDARVLQVAAHGWPKWGTPRPEVTVWDDDRGFAIGLSKPRGFYDD